MDPVCPAVGVRNRGRVKGGEQPCPAVLMVLWRTLQVARLCYLVFRQKPILTAGEPSWVVLPHPCCASSSWGLS